MLMSFNKKTIPSHLKDLVQQLVGVDFDLVMLSKNDIACGPHIAKESGNGVEYKFYKIADGKLEKYIKTFNTWLPFNADGIIFNPDAIEDYEGDHITVVTGLVRFLTQN